MGAVMYTNQNRAFNYAVLVSIVLHGLLLFGFSALRDPSRRPAAPPGPIVARLVPPQAAPAPVAPQAEPAKPEAETSPAPAPVAKPAPAPKPSPVAKPQAKAPTKAPTKAAPVAPAAPAAPSADHAPSAPAAPAAAPTAPAAPPVARTEPQPASPAPSADPADVGSLAQYRLQLIGVAKRYKRYPRVAMDNNWEGDVVVRMVIGANGMIASVSVKTSSGHEVLDQQAVEMFKKAKPLVPIPAALRGKEFTIELRAIYNLKDQASG